MDQNRKVSEGLMPALVPYFTLGENQQTRIPVTDEIAGAAPVESAYFGSIAQLVEQTAV